MIDEISKFIENQWKHWFSGIPAPRRLRFLKTTSSLSDRSFINLFVFADDQPQPTLLLRIPRDSEATQRLIDQDQKFRKVKAILSEPLSSNLPTEYGVFFVNDIHVSVSLITDLPPMTSSSKTSEQIAKDYQDSFNWLIEFHQATSSHIALFSEEIINSTIVKLIEEGQKAGCYNSIEETFLQRIVDKARQNIGLAVPLGWIHGDFWPRNILADRNSLMVIDWEYCTDQALPFLDMFIFCLGYGLSLEPTGENRAMDGFRKTFFQPGILSELSEKHILDYMEKRKINPILGEIYFPLAILELELRQKRSGKSGDNQKIRLERFSYLAEHEAEKLLDFSASKRVSDPQ
jgi:aminoglycoside phosphotransferase (APT) family kinase protein